MTQSQLHRCTVQVREDGAPYLAFEPTDGDLPTFSNSHFTLDLHPGVTLGQAETLALAINRHLSGVSSTIF